MKKTLIIFLTVCATTSVFSQVKVDGNKWNAHGTIPRSQDFKLEFRRDSFFLLTDNGREYESMIFSLQHDSLHFRKITGFSPCNEGSEGLYKLVWAEDGKNFSFQPINDPCQQRGNFFTHLTIAKIGDGDLQKTRSYMSMKKDSVPGISLYGAYELLKGRRSQPVIVAVTGGGIDREHEDLKEVMWTNEKEIAGNGIDDDKNGYIDDTWGWNFLSDKKGNTVERLPRDFTYIYEIWKDKYENADVAKLKPEEKAEYAIYQKAKKEWSPKYPFVNVFKLTVNDSARFLQTVKEFADQTSYDRMPRQTLISLDPGTDPFKIAVKKVLLSDFFVQSDSMAFGRMLQTIPIRWSIYRLFVNDYVFDFDTEYDALKMIGDDPLNVYQHNYGSPVIKKTSMITFSHDTHIAGVIGAKRNNGKGMDGIVDNVKIMVVKMGAGGDERDKDVANAIRYAVDNGAKVINMSWGKKFSSHKKVVDDAIHYAAEKDVLLVHCAGNDGNDCDTVVYYPSTRFLDGKPVENMLVVGSSRAIYDSHLPAIYSNYGKNTVHLFAPGDESYGPFPNNEYGYAGGTSNATPFVVGVAALLKSYFPELTMLQIKNIILESVYRPDIKVIRPHFINPLLAPAVKARLQNEGELVPFSSLSVTGGILDAEAAVRKAIELTSKNNSPGMW